MLWVIKDTNTNEYYRRSAGASGWYSADINFARLFTSKNKAQQTINTNNHHVSYPGNRNLITKEITLNEVVL